MKRSTVLNLLPSVSIPWYIYTLKYCHPDMASFIGFYPGGPIALPANFPNSSLMIHLCNPGSSFTIRFGP